MAKKNRVPAPPVQAPKRRDTPRPARVSLPAWPRAVWGGIAVVVAVAIAVGVYLGVSGGRNLPLAPLSTLGKLKAAPAPGPKGPEDVPMPNAKKLVGAGYITLGQTLDGITCGATEMLNYHIHAHLTIFVDGAARVIPYGIGIQPPLEVSHTGAGVFVVSGTCFAWLHTHANDGIIHIESPSPKTYTLGDFFDIWHQPLSRDQVGPAKGHVTAFFNGKVYTGNLKSIPLLKHAQIQLDVGKPLVAPENISWTSTGL